MAGMISYLEHQIARLQAEASHFEFIGGDLSQFEDDFELLGQLIQSLKDKVDVEARYRLKVLKPDTKFCG